jgi:hypothetical protein
MAKPSSTAAKKNECLSCKKVEAPGLRGAFFDAKGENGMQLRFWLCEPCAIKHSPSQGKVTLQDPTTRV